MERNISDKVDMKGNLSVNFYDKKGRFIEHKDLGSNLIVNNAKLVMSHLLGQSSSTSGVINGISAYDPRVTQGTLLGGINGNVVITNSAWNPTPTQLQPLYMAFGSNTIDLINDGPSPALTQAGLFNAINKSGAVAGLGASYTASSFFYGGTTGDNAFVVQYLANQDGVSDASVRFITRMKTYQGQIPGGSNSQVYKEAGLFTTLFYPNGSPTENCPVMIARKTFPAITKTDSLEVELVWQISL